MVSPPCIRRLKSAIVKVNDVAFSRRYSDESEEAFHFLAQRTVVSVDEGQVRGLSRWLGADGCGQQ